MPCHRVVSSEVAHPTGDPNFAVMQPFPAAVAPEESDPFLMCDEFGPSRSPGLAAHPDEFPVDWHQHVGMDIMTYLKSGTGRHADSMGNRGEFASPGFQWCSVGSGIEHAEGGGSAAGVMRHGFQIWLNVPAARKRDDPRYGTVPPEAIPVIHGSGFEALLLAGPFGETLRGPFETAQPVQMVDFDVQPGVELHHPVPFGMDCCMLYVYEGLVAASGTEVKAQQIAVMDADSDAARNLEFVAGPDGAKALLFAGKRIRENIKWRGGLVMNTKAEIDAVLRDIRSGAFPPKRAPWDYRRISEFPTGPKTRK